MRTDPAALPPAEPSRWVVDAARLGHAARGVVFATIGVMAVRAAFFGRPDEVTGAGGALRTLLRQPFGQLVLAVVGVGLAGFAVWMAVRAVRNTDLEPRTPIGYVNRAGFVLGVAGHALLAYTALHLISSAGPAPDERQGEAWLAWLMSNPAGWWGIAAVGAGVLVQGSVLLYRAIDGDPSARMDLSALRRPVRRSVRASARVGEAAKALVYMVAGVLVIRAAQQMNPRGARGIEGALEWLLFRPYGRAVLAGVGLGLVVYGASELTRARYQEIGKPAPGRKSAKQSA
jgi:hypothetical protein